MITLHQGDSQSVVISLKSKSESNINISNIEFKATLLSTENKPIRIYSTQDGTIKRDGNVMMFFLDQDIPPGSYIMQWQTTKGKCCVSIFTSNFLKIIKTFRP